MASPTQPPAGGGKVLGLKPRTAIIAGGGILLLAVGYFLWKKHQAAATPAVTSASASSSTGIDYGGELSVIQSELEDLLAAEGQESSATGGSSTTGTSTGTTGTGTTTGSTTGTTTATKTAAPAMPSAHETKVTSNSVTLAWTKVTGATSYRIRVTYQGKLVGSPHVTAGTSATISGLTADHTYTFHVASIGPGGTSAETNGPAVKTSK
jgi:fibronectin type III domain protein